MLQRRKEVMAKEPALPAHFPADKLARIRFAQLNVHNVMGRISIKKRQPARMVRKGLLEFVTAFGQPRQSLGGCERLLARPSAGLGLGTGLRGGIDERLKHGADIIVIRDSAEHSVSNHLGGNAARVPHVRKGVTAVAFTEELVVEGGIESFQRATERGAIRRTTGDTLSARRMKTFGKGIICRDRHGLVTTKRADAFRPRTNEGVMVVEKDLRDRARHASTSSRAQRRSLRDSLMSTSSSSMALRTGSNGNSTTVPHAGHGM
jgi:hypothetical protein